MVVHGNPTQPSSPYNPILPAQIAQSGLSYLALGHIHQASGLFDGRRDGVCLAGLRHGPRL